MTITLKLRLIDAWMNNQIDDDFTIFDIRRIFPDVRYNYVSAFLPCSTIEPGRTVPSRTRFLIRTGKGRYRFHPSTLDIITQPEAKTS